MFLATLSHEMRTPLNAIVGWLSILRHEYAETRHFGEGLKVIEPNTHAQVQPIDDVLDVSRIVSGKLRVDIHPCELTDAINVGVNVMRPAAEARPPFRIAQPDHPLLESPIFSANSAGVIPFGIIPWRAQIGLLSESERTMTRITGRKTSARESLGIGDPSRIENFGRRR